MFGSARPAGDNARVSSEPDFERLYAGDPDPWRVATSWYERRKTQIALACLRRETYRLVWDIGCGTGELTAHLASRAERVVAVDSALRACELTAARCVDLPGVMVEQCAAPTVPAVVSSESIGPDLVVLSEVLYYLTASARRATMQAVLGHCAPGADVLAVHWTARPEDARVSGLKVHRELDEVLLRSGWGRLLAHRDIEFTLTMWSRDVPDTMGR